MATHNTQGTVPLDELDDFKVADGAPDVRGWNVLTTDGREIGEVKELLVDTAQMRVRYLSVELDKKLAGDRDDRRILLPIGTARLDDRDDRVIVDAADVSALQGLPAYTGAPLTREYESDLRGRFGTAGAGAPADTVAGKAAGDENDFYTGSHFDEDRFYGKRDSARDAEARRITRADLRDEAR